MAGEEPSLLPARLPPWLALACFAASCWLSLLGVRRPESVSHARRNAAADGACAGSAGVALSNASSCTLLPDASHPLSDAAGLQSMLHRAAPLCAAAVMLVLLPLYCAHVHLTLECLMSAPAGQAATVAMGRTVPFAINVDTLVRVTHWQLPVQWLDVVSGRSCGRARAALLASPPYNPAAVLSCRCLHSMHSSSSRAAFCTWRTWAAKTGPLSMTCLWTLTRRGETSAPAPLPFGRLQLDPAVRHSP